MESDGLFFVYTKDALDVLTMDDVKSFRERFQNTTEIQKFLDEHLTESNASGESRLISNSTTEKCTIYWVTKNILLENFGDKL